MGNERKDVGTQHLELNMVRHLLYIDKLIESGKSNNYFAVFQFAKSGFAYWLELRRVAQITENNYNSKITADELIHKICQIATNGIKYNSNKEMAEINNLPLGIVNRVLRGEYRTDISSQYNIQYSTKKRKSFTEEEIHSICQDFMDGYAVNKIVERRNRNKNDIWKIIRREKYSEIGKMYNFESIRPDLNYTVEYNSN